MFSKSATFLKRFFEPLSFDKLETLKSILLVSAILFWLDVMPIVAIPKLLNYIQTNNIESLHTLVFGYVIILASLFVIRYFVRGPFWYSPRKNYAHLEKKYRPMFLKKDSLYFEKNGTGKIQSMVDSGMTFWAKSSNESIWHIIRIIIVFTLSYSILSKIGFEYFIYFIIGVVLITLNYAFMRGKKYKVDYAHRGVRNEFVANSVRSIMSRNEIIFSGKADFEAQKLFDLKQKEYSVSREADKYGFLSFLPGEFIGLVLPFVGALLYIYSQGGVLDAPQIIILTAFVYFASRAVEMVWSFFKFASEIMDAMPDINKLWDFIDKVPEIKNYETGNTFIHRGGEIILNNVNFSYMEIENVDQGSIAEKIIESKNILQDFNLKIKAGSRVALVGRSGSGKTTIAKLISGYMRPSAGQVLVDGQDLSEVSLKSYYKYIGYLTQEPMVFDGSIRDNLLYASSAENNISEEKLMEVIKLAQCDFVLKTPKGLDTQIGEKGIRLSGGERQRLAIAKLMLKNPEIIILDEPTSALDSFSEDLVSTAMNELFKGRTVIIIAHRLQTVKSADEIIVLEEGQIKERGKHSELIASNGIYAKMLEMQSGF